MTSIKIDSYDITKNHTAVASGLPFVLHKWSTLCSPHPLLLPLNVLMTSPQVSLLGH